MPKPPADALESSRQAAHDVALRRRLRGDIYSRSKFNRARLDRAGLGKKGLNVSEDLTRLPPMGLDDIRAIEDLLLTRSPQKNRKYGAARWTSHQGTPLAYSARDVRLLADLGAEVLERAGLKDGDVIADFTDSGDSRDQLQIRKGAEKARIPLVSVGSHIDARVIADLDASVIVGDMKSVAVAIQAAMQNGLASRIHTAIITGEMLSPQVEKEVADGAASAGMAVVRMWAPPGVLAAWSQCRGGQGLHTWPKHEFIEVVDDLSGLPAPKGLPGRILWTGTDWFATAMVRLRTNGSGWIDTKPCDHCGRTSPRVMPFPAVSFGDVLDADADIDIWASELHRTSKGEELLVWVAASQGTAAIDLVSGINKRIGPAQVQVVDRAKVASILEAAAGERFGDRRAFSLEDDAS